MLPDSDAMNGWNATDEEPVTVQVHSAAAVQLKSAHESPPRNLDTASPVAAMHGSNDAMRMRIAAIVGVSIVLVCTAFYFGVLNLRGAIIDGQSDVQTITITKEGEFSPSALAVHTGESVTLTNENADPQVLKSKDGRELFPVQVLFDTPFTFTVPSDATGEYVYTSETLPNERTLTFTVNRPLGDASSSAASSANSAADTDTSSDLDIPLPFGSGPLTPIPAVPQISSSSSVSSIQSSSSSRPVTPVTIQHSNEAAKIALTNGSSDQDMPSLSQNALPTNPYTVNTQESYLPPVESVIPVTNETLHSGAPLQEIQVHTPSEVTETGPQGALLLLLPAFLGLILLYRRTLRNA